MAECEDTIGSYNCTCNTGYTGDGLNCSGQHQHITQARTHIFIIEVYTYVYTTQILMNVMICYMTAMYLLSASTSLVSTIAVVLRALKEMGPFVVSF